MAGSKRHTLCKRACDGRSRSSKDGDFGSNRKCIREFLLMINSNLEHILPFLRYDDSLALKSQLSLPHFHLTPSLGMNSFEFLDEPLIPRSRVLEPAVSEDFMILACTVLTQCQRVTADGRTDILSSDDRQHTALLCIP